MELEIGAIYEGKVTGITKFGAFVQLPGGKSGMVHISEIANSYVDDIGKFLKDGQQVQVKLIGIDQANRINLSIKKALPQEEQAQQARPARPQQRPFRPAAGKPTYAHKGKNQKNKPKSKGNTKAYKRGR